MLTEYRDDMYFSNDIGTIKYQLTIPSNSISLDEYNEGCCIVLGNGRKPLFLRWTFWLVISALPYIINASILKHLGLHLYFSGWSEHLDGDLFYFTGSGAISVFLYSFIFGMVALYLFNLRQDILLNKKFYLENDLIRNGYQLEIGERGIRYSTRSGGSYLHWQDVKSVVRCKSVDILSLDSMQFLWLPLELADKNYREDILSFIEDRIHGSAV